MGSSDSVSEDLLSTWVSDVFLVSHLKKLEPLLIFPKQAEEGEDSLFLKTGKPDHKEGTAQLKVLSGIDYSRSKYESLLGQDKEQSSPLSPRHLGPVNRKYVEKVAPPEITQNLRALFESKDLPDTHKVKKMDADTKDTPETKAEKRSSLVRSTDTKEKCEFEQGRAKKISEMWGKQEESTTKKKGPIKLVDDDVGPGILESQPKMRDDVVHASAVQEKDLDRIASGRAKAMRESFLKSQEDKPKERKQIKLFEETDGTPAVLESEPVEAPEGVVRAADTNVEDVSFVRGNISSKKDFFKMAADRSAESTGSRKPVNIHEGTDEDAVKESQPEEAPEGVVRATAPAREDLSNVKGDIASKKGFFMSAASQKTEKQRKQINIHEGAEEGVVRAADGNVEDVSFVKGNIKSKTGFFAEAATKKAVSSKKPINIHEGSEADAVKESEPSEAPEGIVRAADTNVEDVAFVRGNISSKKDFFKTAIDESTKSVASRKPINIHEGAEEDSVKESQPQVLEGVVKAGGQQDDFSVEKGKAKSLKSRFQHLTEEQHMQKEPKQIQLDIDSGPAVIENEPVVNPDVVRSGETSDTVLFTKQGHAKSTAKQFLSQQDDTPKAPKQPIKLDIAEGPAVIENQPMAGDQSVVRSTYEPPVKQIERGNIHGALSFHQKAQEEVTKVKTSAEKGASWLQEIEAGKVSQDAMFALHDEERKLRSSESKPAWQLELEQAKRAQQANGNAEEGEDTGQDKARVYDEDEQQVLMQTKKAGKLKAMFQQLEQEQDEPRRGPPPKQLVRFTPPREVTPERQQVYADMESHKPQEQAMPDYYPPPEVPITSSTTLMFSQTGHS